MTGTAILVVGGTGSGKTTFIKKCIERVPPASRFIYDVNNEYGLVDYDLPSFDDFAELTSRVKNGFLVYEEATIFLSNRGTNNHLREILVRKRHTKNTILLVFHSLRSVPRYIFDLCNSVVLFQTNDSADLVQSKFGNDKFTTLFTRLNSSPRLQGKNGGTFSPSVIVRLN